ncbi:MAG TPA: DUF3108 domain-containing protein, partial [Gemmatimonadaceae bacterium]|nr:DUF3108 domain-containing protein [Gemmatimonadaceae bacterium]
MLLPIVGLLGAADYHAAATSWPAARPARAAAAPFHVGEKLTYDAKLNFINAGTATMSVEGIDTI